LDVRLLERNTHSTRSAWTGQVFLDEAKRVLFAVDQAKAKASAKAAALGYRGTLRIALSDGIDPLRCWPNAVKKSWASKSACSKCPWLSS
jgi:DNA-binding transcriptional LysR family regulator